MNINELNKILNEQIIVVAYFSHDECNVCKVLRPKVEKILDNYTSFKFIYVNTKDSPEISGQYTVFAVPTIIIFTEGKESKRFSRNFALSELQEILDRYEEIMS